MFSSLSRRELLQTAAAGAGVLALGDLGFLNNLPSLSAQEVRQRVQFSPDIEPLVRLIEDTPRDQLLETMGQRLRSGTSYQQVLTALMLAAIRTVRPRPVGFQFHAVLVLNSAHLASLAAQDRDRWLPLFWSLDYYKGAVVRDRTAGWSLAAPAAESQLPPSHQARSRFMEAMDNWDEDGADKAVTALARTAGATEVIETFWRYGCRDFRDIGHKAIYVANAWRTLQTIGWRHAEPILRSLAFALLDHEGGNPAERDDIADRPGRENLRRLTRIRAHWQRGRLASSAATDMLATVRSASPSDASERVVALLNEGIDPASIWDGLFLAAGELLMRQPGIVGLHCVTSINALYFAFQNTSNDETRRFVLLQAPAFLTLFRQRMQRGQLADLRIDTLEPLPTTARGAEAVEEIFAEVSRDRLRAARKVLALQAQGNHAETMLAAARRLIFQKGRDSHDYKFSSAALEDFYHATPAWRDRFLATSMFNLKGTGDRDNDLVRRARAALGNG